MSRYDSYVFRLKQQVEHLKQQLAQDGFRNAQKEYHLTGKLPENECLREEIIFWEKAIKSMVDTLSKPGYEPHPDNKDGAELDGYQINAESDTGKDSEPESSPDPTPEKPFPRKTRNDPSRGDIHSPFYGLDWDK